MSFPLYLDTARIGLLTTEARQSCEDAIALAASDPYHAFREFQSDQESGVVRHWKGVQSLFAAISLALNCSPENFFASSDSASLLRLVGNSLFSLAHKVFIPDLVWPNHLKGIQILSQEWRGQVFVAESRKPILQGNDDETLANFLLQQYDAHECDALFLTAVSSDGIRFPIEKFLSKIKSRHPRFVVVDGAQEFAHIPRVSFVSQADLYLFSSHKWLGAYHPLSFAACGKQSSKRYVDTMLARMINRREINDPTLKASAANNFDYQETINLLPFFSLAGAMQSLADRDHDTSFEDRRHNASTFSEVATQSGWTDRYASLDEEFKTAISVIEKPTSGPDPSELKRRLVQSGVAATVHDDGGIRASMPATPFENKQLESISNLLGSF